VSAKRVPRVTRRRALAISLGAAGVAAAGSLPPAAAEPSVADPPARQTPERPFSTATTTMRTSKRTWVLTDVESDQYVDAIAMGPSDAAGAAAGCSATKRRLHGGLCEGVDVIELAGGPLRVIVVPTRGMGIWRAHCGETLLGWRSPVGGPVHPAFVRLDEPSGLGWLSGFDELMVRCGLEYNGGPEFHPNGILRYGLHGKIANTPARKVEVTLDGERGGVEVSGVVDEARLFGNKLRLASTISMRVGQMGWTVSDTVTNLSAEASELALLYHTNFGPPIGEPGARVLLPVEECAAYDEVSLREIGRWDQCGPESPGAAEVCYFFRLAAATDGRTLAVLHDAAGTKGVRYTFNCNQLPWFTLWKNRQPIRDGYVTGLEPGTDLPNTKSFEKQKGRLVVLGPGESRSFQLTLEFLPDPKAVAAAAEAVAALQRTAKPVIHGKLMPDWSAA